MNQRLTIEIPEEELFDESKNCFITLPPLLIHLEHSLYTISKWESIHQTPFLSKTDKTIEDIISYIKCMSDVDLKDSDINRLSQKNIDDIVKFINNSMSATKFKKREDSGKNELLTSEKLYGYMAMAQIPFECEHWHLNRLMKTLEFIAIKNSPKKKISEAEKIQRYSEINAENKARFGVKD